MGRFRVELDPAAAAEVKAARDWYRLRSLRAADLFLLALDQGIERIALNPDLCPKYIDDTRRYLLRRFPFLLVFRQVSEDLILVVAVAHARRKPGYWKSRPT